MLSFTEQGHGPALVLLHADAGHLSNLENTSAFNQALDEFLNGEKLLLP